MKPSSLKQWIRDVEKKTGERCVQLRRRYNQMVMSGGGGSKMLCDACQQGINRYYGAGQKMDSSTLYNLKDQCLSCAEFWCGKSKQAARIDLKTPYFDSKCKKAKIRAGRVMRYNR